jgi:DNA polymerase-3 subunit delta
MNNDILSIEFDDFRMAFLTIGDVRPDTAAFFVPDGFGPDELREALLAGDVPRLMRTLDGLQQEGEAPLLILWAISEEARALAQISRGLARKQPLAQLCKEARVWGNRQALIRQALSRLDNRRANAALIDAARIDRMIKGLADGDVWNEFRRLGLLLAAG